MANTDNPIGTQPKTTLEELNTTISEYCTKIRETLTMKETMTTITTGVPLEKETKLDLGSMSDIKILSILLTIRLFKVRTREKESPETLFTWIKSISQAKKVRSHCLSESH